MVSFWAQFKIDHHLRSHIIRYFLIDAKSKCQMIQLTQIYIIKKQK